MADETSFVCAHGRLLGWDCQSCAPRCLNCEHFLPGTLLHRGVCADCAGERMRSSAMMFVDVRRRHLEIARTLSATRETLARSREIMAGLSRPASRAANDEADES